MNVRLKFNTITEQTATRKLITITNIYNKTTTNIKISLKPQI